MKSTLTIVLLIGFIGIAVFGFAGVNHSSADTHDGGCIMSVARGMDCPQEKNTADYLAFHLGTFKSFSTAVFGEMFAASVTTLFVVLGLGAAARLVHTLPPLLPVYARRKRIDSLDFSTERELRRSLALREHSPTRL